MIHAVLFLALMAAPGAPKPRPKMPPPPAERPQPLRAKKRPPTQPGPYQTVVIGGLKPAPLLDSHRSVEVLGRRQLLELAARSTPELLSSVPGVVVQRTNHGGGSPFIRGFTGQQILLHR